LDFKRWGHGSKEGQDWLGSEQVGRWRVPFPVVTAQLTTLNARLRQSKKRRLAFSNAGCRFVKHGRFQDGPVLEGVRRLNASTGAEG
jgi:hypothetical protein